MKSKQMSLRCLLVFALLLVLPAAIYAAKPPGIPDGWSDGYVYANGVRLHYYRAVPAPGKPVIVMVHGVTDNGLCWTTLARDLQNDYDIYMLDTRGHGLSDPFTSADDGDTLIKDVVAAVKSLGLEKPILLGHSMGAATVMRIGSEYPDIACAIIMLDPFLPRVDGGRRRGSRNRRDGERDRSAEPRPRPRVNSPETIPNENPASDRLSVQMMGRPETLVAQNNYKFEDLVASGRRKFPKWDDLDIQYWALSKKQYHGAYSDKAWQAMSGSMRTGDSLGKISVPALILKADTSPERRQADQAVVEGLDRVRLVHIEGGGHNLHHDERQHTVKRLTDFLAQLRE